MAQDLTRLDRIERSLELLIQSQEKNDEQFRKMILELRESQKKTDELFRRTDEQFRKTDEQFCKTDEQFRKTDEQFRKTDEQFRKTDEQFRKTDEQFRKTDEQFRKTDEQFRRTDEKLKEIGIQLANLGLVQGEVAEDLFYRNIRYLFKDGVRDIRRNLKKKGVAEYDIVAETKDGVLVVEVKNKLDKRMVDEFVNKRIPRFKLAFPEYRDFRLIGGIGALVVKDEVGKYAEKAGLYVLTQSDEGGAALLNRKGFKAKEF